MATVGVPREIEIHQSVNRPNLLLGADRELVLMTVLWCVILAFSLQSVFGVVLAVVAWWFALYALRRMAKADPLMRRVYARHMRYAAYYPAHARPTGQGVTTPYGW